MCKALFFPNVLDHSERVILDFEAGQTVREWLDESGMADKMRQQPIVIAMNGDPLLEKDWEHELEESDMVALQAAPQAEGVAAIIYWVVVAVTAAYALYTVLTLPDPASDGIETSPNNNLSVRANRARLGQPKPVLYGNSIIYPDVSAFPYSRFDASGDEIVYQLFEVSQGEVTIDTSSMRFESTLLSDFPSSEYEIIPPGSTSTLFPNDVVVVAAVSNIEIDAGLTAEYTVNDPNTDISRILVDVVAPRGIHRQRSSGRKDRMSVNFEIQTRELDDAGTPIGGWVTSLSTFMSGATASPIARTFDIPVTPGRYQVRINRLGSYSADDKLVDQLQWSGLTGLFEDALPVTTTTRVAVRIRSSNEIGSRALTKFNLVAQRLLPTWTELGGWTAPVATNSPAWAAADVLRNTTYGAGRGDAYINLVDLEQLAIDTAALGWECNGVFDTSGTVWDALTRIGHTCNSIPVDEGGVYTMIRDRAQTVPVQMFNMRNILEGTFRLDASPHVEETKDYVEVKFKDETQDYRQTSIDAVIPGGTSNDPLKIEWWGITREAQAWDLGMHIAAANRYRRERITFEAPLEGRIPRYGDLIRVSHFVFGVAGSPQVSGDVTAYDTIDTLTVSEEVPSTYASPFILLQDLDGSVLGPYPFTRINDGQIQITGGFDDSGLVFSNNYPNPRYQMGDGTTFDENVRVLGIQPTQGENVRIEGFIDAPNVYTITDGETQPSPVTLSSLLGFLPQVSEFRGILGGAPGDLEVALSWSGQFADKYDLEYSTDDGTTWIDMGEDLLVAKYVDRPGLTGTIRYRVAGVSVFRGPWVELIVDLDAAIGSANVPAAPNKLNLQSMSDGVSILACVPADQDFADPDRIEIWRATSPDTLITDASAVLVDSLPVVYDPIADVFVVTYSDGSVTGGTSYSYFARGVNLNGSSAYYPVGAGVPVTPSSPSTGGAGPAGADAVAGASILQSWAQDPATGSYDGATPFDLVIPFTRGNTGVIATHTIRGTLAANGTITVSDQGETGEDTNITSTTGSGSRSVRVEITHVASGAVGNAMFTSAGGQDGTDGADGNDGADGVDGADGKPGIPGASTIITYDNLDSSVGNNPGEYGFSPDGTQAGNTGNWGTITGGGISHILLSDSDANDRNWSTFLGQVTLGDVITFYDTARRWIEFRVSTAPDLLNGLYRFPVTVVEFDEADGNGNISGTDPTPIEFRFSRAQVAPSLVSYMPTKVNGNYGDMAGLAGSDLTPVTSTVTVTGAQSYVGSQSILVESLGNNPEVFFGSSNADYNIAIPPNRRWLVTVWVYSPVETELNMRARFRRSSDDTYTTPPAINENDAPAAAAWHRHGLEIDMTADNETLVELRIGATALDTAGDQFYLDAVSLFDVTDFPEYYSNSYTDRNLPPAAFVPPARGELGDAGSNGTNATIGYLTNPTQNVSSAADGTGYNLSGYGGSVIIKDGAATLTSGVTYSVVGDATFNGLTIAIDSDGLYSLSGASWIGTQEMFTLRATIDATGEQFDLAYTITKSPSGSTGAGLVREVDSIGADGDAGSVTITSTGGPITLKISGGGVGFESVAGPGSSTIRIVDSAATVAELTYPLTWSFEAELGTNLWVTPQSSILLETVVNLPAGTYTFTSEWTAGAAASFSEPPILSAETVA